MTQAEISKLFAEVVQIVKEGNKELGDMACLAEQSVLALLNYKLQVAVQEAQSRQVVPAGGSIVNA